jgi:hypothetical protein
LDAQQETTLIFEIDRMRRDAARTLMFDRYAPSLPRPFSRAAIPVGVRGLTAPYTFCGVA